MTVRRKIMLIRLKGAWIWPDVDWRLFCRAPHAKNVTANKRSLDIRQRTEMDVPKPRKEPSVESISAPLAPVDPLGEALNFLRVSGMYYSRSELSEPWGVRLPTFPGCLMFHMLVPHGKGHQIASRAGIPAVKLFDLDREEISERYEMIRHGGGGPTTRAVCCTVRYDHPAAHQLIALLPPLINVQTINAPGKDLIESMIRLLGDEARALSPGSETVITRLADILLIQTIRLWIEQDAATQKGWLGALRDRQLGRALFLIHRHPEQPWTVESLATEVAMSRAGFAARFKEMVGESPMQYVTRGKMHLALTWLKEDDAPLSQLAPRLGYQSEAAFSRAFKRCIGVAPGGIRRRDVWGFID
jgi:AraC-like DNA-binding protein